MNLKRKVNIVCLIFLAWLGVGGILRADERLFGYSYEADLLPKGGMEFEQWATNLNGQASGVFSRWQVREEFEYGALDNLSGSLYLNFNSVYSSQQDPSTGLVTTSDEFTFDGLSTEWKWRLLNPYQGPLGLLLYLEPRYSGSELELEPKLVLQHNFGESWVLAMNLTPETEWGYDAGAQSMHAEEKASLGLAYKVTPALAMGLEVRNDRIRPNWGDESEEAWNLGPSLHYAAEKWWATLAFLPQIQGQPSTIPGDGRFLGDDDFTRAQTRLIAGIEF